MVRVSESSTLDYCGTTCFIILMDLVELLIVMFFDTERRLAYKDIAFGPFVAWTPFYRICQFMQVFLPYVSTAVGGYELVCDRVSTPSDTNFKTQGFIHLSTCKPFPGVTYWH